MALKSEEDVFSRRSGILWKRMDCRLRNSWQGQPSRCSLLTGLYAATVSRKNGIYGIVFILIHEHSSIRFLSVLRYPFLSYCEKTELLSLFWMTESDTGERQARMGVKYYRYLKTLQK